MNTTVQYTEFAYNNILKVACPHCMAYPHYDCKTPSGAVARILHQARRAKAIKEGKHRP